MRDVLLYGGFDLGDEAVALESPTEDHRRLDVAVGAVIIECKRDLRPRANLLKAEAQLGGYLGGKFAAGGHYAGLLTDGAEAIAKESHLEDAPTFQAARKIIRADLDAAGITEALDEASRQLLGR